MVVSMFCFGTYHLVFQLFLSLCSFQCAILSGYTFHLILNHLQLIYSFELIGHTHLACRMLTIASRAITLLIMYIMPVSAVHPQNIFANSLDSNLTINSATVPFSRTFTFLLMSVKRRSLGFLLQHLSFFP